MAFKERLHLPPPEFQGVSSLINEPSLKYELDSMKNSTSYDLIADTVRASTFSRTELFVEPNRTRKNVFY